MAPRRMQNELADEGEQHAVGLWCSRSGGFRRGAGEAGDAPTVLNPDGSFLPAAVAASDGELEKLLKDGLKMELLSWKICREEPTACSLISQALNAAKEWRFARPS